MKEKLAMFRSPQSSCSSALGEWAESWRDYIRLTEYVEVDFQERDKGEVVQEEIAELDKMADEIRAKATEGLTNIQRRKEELLAIEHDGGNNAIT